MSNNRCEKDIFGQITQFNQEVVGIHRDLVKPLSELEAQWLVATLKEETEEFEDALVVDDSEVALQGQADALMDLVYFAVGGLTRLGITPEKMHRIFQVVHNANMSKKKGVKKERAVAFDLDCKKPDGWVSPDSAIHTILFGIQPIVCNDAEDTSEG